MRAQEIGDIKWNKVVGQEHTVSKWWLSEDLAKIEEYLNQMIARGFRPVSIGWTSQFTFVPCAPGEYLCRTAMTVTNGGFYDKVKAAELSDLLVADGSSIVEQYATLGYRAGLIAVRPAAAGPFELTSDLDSRIAEYRARKRYYLLTGLCWFAAAMAFLCNALSFGTISSHWSAFSAITHTIFAFVLPLICVSLFLISSICGLVPAIRYQKAIKRLEAQRDISEV
ncbi:MAG: DUF2812 domain-containing protein [Coriobacteriales bacterium]|jgi:hypothetical protein|nr:DUF2812 domain-containing protein [Coriobacteriales bacterium]